MGVAVIKKFHSLQNRIILFTISMVILPLLVVGTISYIKSSDILQNKVSISNLNTVRQTGNNIEFILKDVHDFSLYLFQNDAVSNFLKSDSNTDFNEIQRRRTEVNRELMYLLTSKNYIHSVYIEGFNGLSLDTRASRNQLNEDIITKARELKGGPLWIFQELENYNNTTTNVISMVRLVNDINNITNRLGILKINISENTLSERYSNHIVGKGEQFYIIDNNYNIISAPDRAKIMKPISPEIIKEEINNNKSGYYQITLNSQEYLVTYYELAYVDYKLINLVPLEQLLVENNIIKNVTIWSILVSFLICLVFIFLFYHRVLHPLHQVRNVMKELENENFDIRLNIKGYNEIAVLGKTFNKMSARLKKLMEQIYLEKVKQKEAELKALQAQVDPHFLYNTLDTIYWMSRMEQAPETSNLIKALAKLFRLSLNKGDEFTTVEKELEHLENYIIIQKKRYQGLINFSINVEEDLLSCRVVKLVLQPLVENAIYHGIEKNGGKGNITVNIKKEVEYLIYEIIDDGQGVDIEELNRLLQEVKEDNRGFGIKNVNDRIKLYFENDCGLSFYSKPGQGTKVVVKQRYIKEGENNVQHDNSR